MLSKRSIRNLSRTTAVVAVCAALLPLLAANSWVAFADTQTYTPPTQPGYIYTVILYKRTALKTLTTRVSVRWGGYNKTDSVSPPQVLPGRAVAAKGFVVRLKHSKNDSVPLTIDTDGRITQGPFQGNPPGEWNNGDYRHIEW